MLQINQCILLGNLTRDPESRFLQNGGQVCQFGLAVNKTIGQNQDGSKREKVLFIDIECWGKQAESCQQFLRKGAMVAVVGELELDQFQDQQGQQRNKHKIRAFDIRFGPAPQGGQQPGPQGGFNGQPQGYGQQGQQPRQQRPPQQQPQGYAPPPQQGGYAPPPGQPAGGYAPPPQQPQYAPSPAQQQPGGYAPQPQGYAPPPQQQPAMAGAGASGPYGV